MRIETGPFKPEDDWTGYFVRGDVALGESGLFRTSARLLAEMAKSNDALSASDRVTIDCACILLNEWADRFAQVYEGN